MTKHSTTIISANIYRKVLIPNNGKWFLINLVDLCIGGESDLSSIVKVSKRQKPIEHIYIYNLQTIISEKYQVDTYLNNKLSIRIDSERGNIFLYIKYKINFYIN